MRPQFARSLRRLIYSLGPLMPFLSTELNLNYTISGLHFSAYALGMTLAGFTGERVSLGRIAMAVGSIAMGCPAAGKSRSQRSASPPRQKKTR